MRSPRQPGPCAYVRSHRSNYRAFMHDLIRWQCAISSLGPNGPANRHDRTPNSIGHFVPERHILVSRKGKLFPCVRRFIRRQMCAGAHVDILATGAPPPPYITSPLLQKVGLAVQLDARSGYRTGSGASACLDTCYPTLLRSTCPASMLHRDALIVWLYIQGILPSGGHDSGEEQYRDRLQPGPATSNLSSGWDTLSRHVTQLLIGARWLLARAATKVSVLGAGSGSWQVPGGDGLRYPENTCAVRCTYSRKARSPVSDPHLDRGLIG